MRYIIHHHNTAVAEFETDALEPIFGVPVRRLPGFRALRDIVVPWPQPPAALLEPNSDPTLTAAWVERVLGPRRDLARSLELRTEGGAVLATSDVWLSAIEILPGAQPLILAIIVLDDAVAPVPALRPPQRR